MASASAARARKKAAQRKKAAAQKSGLPMFWIVIGVVVVLFAAAIVMTRSDSETPESSGAADIQETRAVSVTGDALPQFQEGADAAVGQEVPAIEGKSFDGENISITNDGRPKMVLLLAHWCSVCQQEVPVVQEWIDTNGMPEGVDLYSIATSTSEGQGNYPPSDWLEREEWSLPVIADSAQYEASDAFGLTAFPFFVFVNSDGTVAQRLVGAQSAEQIAQAVAQLN